MALRSPYLEVNGPSGDNLVPIWGTGLKAVKIVTYLDFMMDELTLTFSNKPPYKKAPPNGTRFSVKLGWSKDAAVDRGTFFVQRLHLSGNPSSGETLSLICRAAEFDTTLNQVDSQHFGPETGEHTLGDVFRSLFRSTGKTVQISPGLDNLPIPGDYHLRWNETALHTAEDLAQNNGGIVKVAADKILVLQLDKGQSISGNSLGPIAIDHAACYEYDCEIEPRFSYASVSCTWFDPSSGRLKSESSPTLQDGGQAGGLPHIAGSQAEAAAIAKANADEFGREGFTGLFVIPGSATAQAGADVQCTGFPDPIDDAKLQCETLTDDVIPDKGWTTTVEVRQVPS